MQISFFFFNDPAPTEISTLPLPAALPPPSSPPRADAGPSTGRAPSKPNRRRRKAGAGAGAVEPFFGAECAYSDQWSPQDRKSTRLNSSHANISYAVFCLKKKTTIV